MPLRGLGVQDVQHMLASLSGQESPAYVARLVHRQTEGNPLFVQELFRYLAEQGLWDTLTAETLQAVDQDSSLAVRIPEGLRGSVFMSEGVTEKMRADNPLWFRDTGSERSSKPDLYPEASERHSL